MDGRHDGTSGTLAPPSGSDAPESPATPATPPLDKQPAGDILSDVLQVVRLTGALFFFVEASAPWASEAPDSSTLAPVILPDAQHLVSYHVILEGSCWCSVAGEEPMHLEAGDVVVVPHGQAYSLASRPGVASGISREEGLSWFRAMAAGQLPFVADEGRGGSERIRLICGFLGCDALPFNPVLATLPRVFRVRRPATAEGDRLSALIDLAAAEAAQDRPGRRVVLLRLSEVMFVEVVRRYLTTGTVDAGGWLAGLRDPIVGRALSLLHRQPAFPWTLELLARETAASRSVLADRFTHLVGRPPMRYLSDWRMQLAAALLADREAKVASVARQVGYDSEAAFSRAFKNVTGLPPAAWKKRSRHA